MEAIIRKDDADRAIAASADPDGLPGGALNMGHEAVDRHVAQDHGDAVAMRWIGRDDSQSVSRSPASSRNRQAKAARLFRTWAGFSVGKRDLVFDRADDDAGLDAKDARQL